MCAVANNLEPFWIRWQTDNHSYRGVCVETKMRDRTGKCDSGLNDEPFDVVCQHEVFSCLFFIQRFFHMQSLIFDVNTLGLHIAVCLVPLCT